MARTTPITITELRDTRERIANVAKAVALIPASVSDDHLVLLGGYVRVGDLRKLVPALAALQQEIRDRRAGSRVTQIETLRQIAAQIEPTAQAGNRMYAMNGSGWINLAPGAEVRVSDLRATGAAHRMLAKEIRRRDAA